MRDSTHLEKNEPGHTPCLSPVLFLLQWMSWVPSPVIAITSSSRYDCTGIGIQDVHFN